MKIEFVSPEDAEELLAIYTPYVLETAISFEYDVPTVEEFRQRILTTTEKYPYLKAVEQGRILGYAYAHPFIDRRAYDWSVETTIYLHHKARKKGIGRALYEALEGYLQAMGICNMNACIAVPNGDRYVTDASIRFHEKMGFVEVGTFHGSGYKFDHWYDMVWMEKLIGEHKSGTAPVDFQGWALHNG